MKYSYGISDKVIAYLTLLSGLVISAVAVWYSVAGLVSIFAASAFSIIIMGVALEVSKLVATVWLKWNWSRAPRLIKIYLISAIAVLMLITSMGIFGYLSKAHLDQSLVSGDVVDKIAIIDEKIRTQRDNIEAARKALRQMDEAVDQTMARSNDEKGADKAAALRRAQQRERTNLQNDISRAQGEISKLNEERAPIAKEVRKVEAEVGPIKYIAKLIYGDNPDANILEKAVTWVIIIIVLVFDPLAVVLLLSSQYSFQWFRQEKDDSEGFFENARKIAKKLDEESQEMPSDIYEVENLADEKIEKTFPQANRFWPFPIKEKNLQENDDKAAMNIDAEPIPGITERPFTAEEIKALDGEPTEIQSNSQSEDTNLESWNKMIEEAEKAVDKEREIEDYEIIETAPENEKQAMAAWKHDHPDSSLKLQRKLLDKGVIAKLPWEDYLKPKADFSDDDAALEAAKWAMEQVEKKGEQVVWMEHDEQGNQLTKSKNVYQQNAEQNERTIWQRIQDAKK